MFPLRILGALSPVTLWHVPDGRHPVGEAGAPTPFQQHVDWSLGIGVKGLCRRAWGRCTNKQNLQNKPTKQNLQNILNKQNLLNLLNKPTKPTKQNLQNILATADRSLNLLNKTY